MISVVIPSYKNKPMLVRNLQHNLRFLHGCEVIVVNDDPAASLADLYESVGVKVIENKHNLGFGEAVNKGFEQAHGARVLLLNSDVLLQDTNYLKAEAQMQANRHIFAISFAQQENDSAIEGKKRLYWYKGFLNHSHASNLEYGRSGWAEGGTCLVDRRKFLELGGFDGLYKPFYWEDIDLSYRAWKTGYEIYFDPEVLVQHHHESTIGKYFSRSYIKYISFRNQLIFIWKNITDPDLLSSHMKHLFTTLVGSLLRGQWYMIAAFIATVIRIGAIRRQRRNQRLDYKYTDQQILAYFKDT